MSVKPSEMSAATVLAFQTKLGINANTQYTLFLDPTTGRFVRMGTRVLSGDTTPSLVVDRELNATGFTGAESTDDGVTGDWINVTYFK